jgi:hypothetical protein
MTAGGAVIDYVAASRVHRLSSLALSDAEMVMNRELAAEPLCDKENTEDDRRQSAPPPPLYYALFDRWSHALSSPAVGFHRRSGCSRVIWTRLDLHPCPSSIIAVGILMSRVGNYLGPHGGRWRRQPVVGMRPLTAPAAAGGDGESRVQAPSGGGGLRLPRQRPAALCRQRERSRQSILVKVAL